MNLIAQSELEKLQQGDASSYWSDRFDNPLMMSTWDELALCQMAWAWLDKSRPPRDPLWKTLWEHAAAWPIPEEDTPMLELALQSWATHPIWNVTLSKKLVARFINADYRDWSTLINAHELAPTKFSYHLLHCLVTDVGHFEKVNYKNMWETVMKAPSLIHGQKENILLGFLMFTNERWEKMGWRNDIYNHDTSNDIEMDIKKTTPWFQELYKALPRLQDWFKQWLQINHDIGVTPTRTLLAEHWLLSHQKNAYVQQTQQYQNIDFSL